MWHPSLNIFQTLRGTSFVTINSRHNEVLAGGKSNPMQGRVTRVSTGTNAIISQDKNSSLYYNMVRRRMEAEGISEENFTPGVRRWGERIKGTPILHHNDKFYLACIILKYGKVEYFLDGKPICVNNIEGYKPTVIVPQAGMSKPIIHHIFSFDSITELKYKKKWYQKGIDF